MIRTIRAASTLIPALGLIGLGALSAGCISSQSDSKRQSNSTALHNEPVVVPWVPLPGESGYGETAPSVPAAGVAHAGGLRGWLPPLTPEANPWLRPPGSTNPTVGPRRQWPWEDRNLSQWERWFAVHGRILLDRAVTSTDNPDGADRAGSHSRTVTTQPVNLKGARRWLTAAGDRDLQRATALATGAWQGDAADLVAALGKIQGDRSALLWALGSAGRARASDGRTPSAERAVAALIAELANRKTPESERLIICIALGRAGGPAAVTALTRVLADGDASDAQRYSAAIGLAVSGDRTSVAGLTGVLTNRQVTPRVRGAALVALTRLDARAGMQRCNEVLRRGSGPGADERAVRLAAAGALGASGSPEAIDTLIAVLNGSFVTARFDERALVAVCDHLDRRLRTRAREALIAGVGERGPLTAADAVAIACAAVPRKARQGVGEVLRTILGKVSRAGIVEDEAVRGLAALGLGRCAARAERADRAKAARALRVALDDKHYAVRGFAALGLGLAGDAIGRQPLRDLLRAPDPAMRAVGSIGLGLLGDKGASRALAKLAGRGAPLQRWGALWGLGLAADPAVIQPAARLLGRRSHPDLRATAAIALTAVTTSEADHTLQQTMTDRHATVRREAARALGRQADARRISQLATALRKQPREGHTRIALLEALAAAGDREHLGEVADILRGIPSEIVPELAAALLRTLEPSYRPTRY